MPPKHNNDEALAYGYMMLLAYFAASIMIVLSWAYVINIINTEVVNPMAEEGTVSVQTMNATAWNVNVIRYAPVPILLFGFIFGVNRGIFKRSTGG
jgi:hypothetical protein